MYAGKTDEIMRTRRLSYLRLIHENLLQIADALAKVHAKIRNEGSNTYFIEVYDLHRHEAGLAS